MITPLNTLINWNGSPKFTLITSPPAINTPKKNEVTITASGFLRASQATMIAV